MKKIFMAIVIICAMFIPGFWNQALASGHGKEINAEKLFESRCSVCHSIDRPKSKTKTKEGWEATVVRMQNKSSGLISDKEASIISEYLAETYGK